MPTARELLEQADALMRRNRSGDAGIPVLTDAIHDEAPTPRSTGPSTRERTTPAFRGYAADARAPRERAERNEADWVSDNAPVHDQDRAGVSQDVGEQAPPAALPAHDVDAFTRNDDGDDLEPPLLTDVVDERAVDLVPLPPEVTEGEPSVWLGADTIDPALHSITGPAPDTIAVVPPVTFRSAEPQAATAQQAEERDPTITRTLRAAGSEPTPPPTRSEPTPPPTGSEPTAPPTGSEPTPTDGGEIPTVSTREPVHAEAAKDEERWRALAEQISMQVLQRLDLFIDTGLKTQLASHLQPIVARAGAELVETINAHVGQLVQAYVAEAIEREIAHWRKQQK